MTQRHRPGPLGTSCLTCKRRHKKCDQRQPICQRCEAGGYECLGYDHNSKAPVHKSLPKNTLRPIASQDMRFPPDSILGLEREGSISELPSGSGISPQVCFCVLGISGVPDTMQETPPEPTTSTLYNATSSGPVSERDVTSFVDPRTSLVEDYLRLLATQSIFKYTDDPTVILHKIVRHQSRLPYSPFDPVKTFLNSPWFVDYVMEQVNNVTGHWYFKPTNHNRDHFSRSITRRLATSYFSRWLTLVGIAIIQSFLKGDVYQNSQHDFWVGHVEGSAKRELTRELAPREMQERRNDWIHVSLMRVMILRTTSALHILQDLAPTFLQVVYSDPTLWSESCNPAYVPLTSVLNSEATELAFFVLIDCTCAMAFGLPQQIEYDTTTYLQPNYSPSHQWAHSTPIYFQGLLAGINACRDKSPAARNWRDIELELVRWESRPGEHTFTESWMMVAWYAVQESWRLALLAYLYMAVCDVASDDPRVESSVKQLLQVIGTVRSQKSSIAGICARNEVHRRLVREKLLASHETKLWIMRASDFVPVLEDLWHGAAVGGSPIKWSDYMRSRQTVLPVC
ncbi:fungal zn(2)-Cys(6) binuclear cluster domain-containing protein [Rhizoctonia solani AG-1 IA]|uniref:Fungal zn(2)-Cys(6) binuclear cluster domain-containing protein n=1 Tax=Thanatephorus cucumeris (strain AG1-IA) TaxID=983506 RepID=L8WJ02_THACA|nr:fungal zn(2)-Cys(6) binuclear cluster domain-containing protein [Rhizoctonia solani AG-1 IA]